MVLLQYASWHVGKLFLHTEPLCWETRHPYPVNESLLHAHILFTTMCLEAEIWGSAGGCPPPSCPIQCSPGIFPLPVPQVEARSWQGLRSQPGYQSLHPLDPLGLRNLNTLDSSTPHAQGLPPSPSETERFSQSHHYTCLFSLRSICPG